MIVMSGCNEVARCRLVTSSVPQKGSLVGLSQVLIKMKLV